ncbi:MAG: hypothetical protein WCO26_26035, partial [Deltaproteobacteria bacterium]
GHSSPQQSWGVFWHIFIKIGVIVQSSGSGYLLVLSPLLDLRHRHGIMVNPTGESMGEDAVLNDGWHITDRRDEV